MAERNTNTRTRKTTTKTTPTEKSVGVATEKVVVAERKQKLEPLNDYDEIQVISILPNVSYKDNRTNDMYEWEEVGHIEYMTVETIKNMWRNNKGYFRNMILKPNDERLINQFGLKSNYEKYEYLMNKNNYTRNNIKDVCKKISSTHNGLKFSIINKIKFMISTGELSDISVIKTLERQLHIDLISLL